MRWRALLQLWLRTGLERRVQRRGVAVVQRRRMTVVLRRRGGGGSLEDGWRADGVGEAVEGLGWRHVAVVVQIVVVTAAAEVGAALGPGGDACGRAGGGALCRGGEEVAAVEEGVGRLAVAEALEVHQLLLEAVVDARARVRRLHRLHRLRQADPVVSHHEEDGDRHTAALAHLAVDEHGALLAVFVDESKDVLSFVAARLHADANEVLVTVVLHGQRHV
mmetsp:Transcript_19253/g.73953  ORF Transcript_19253/g.73953 Transcript_19253/m.73953 type:complete len:220 (-) Transcript_19253:1166-1825(-)